MTVAEIINILSNLQIPSDTIVLLGEGPDSEVSSIEVLFRSNGGVDVRLHG